MNSENDNLVTGKVTGIEPYGIFVSFENNYTGLIHISEISSSFVRNINDYAVVGDYITSKVIGIDEKNKKLRLSLIELNSANKNRRKGIVETKNGFQTLKNELNSWILNKIDKK